MRLPELVIRDAQLLVLSEGVLRTLEDRLIEHARTHFPAICAELKDDLRPAIAAAIAGARRYGFNGQREICKYLNLVFVFGRHFDRDPACSWAHPLLRGALPGVPKMERLYGLALQHEREAKGYFAGGGAA